MKIFGYLMLFVLAASPLLAQSASVAEEEDVKATLVAMWQAIEEGDLDRYASFVHPDFTSFGENDVYLASGKEYEIRSYGEYLQRARNVHTDMHQPEVTVRVLTYFLTSFMITSWGVLRAGGQTTDTYDREDDVTE